MAKINLIIGGARSGKSRLAEQRARASGAERVYLATATAGDTEMAERIVRHQNDRAQHGWKTIEEPLDLASVLEANTDNNQCVLVDCLTLWLSNCLHADNWSQQKAHFMQFLAEFSQGASDAQIILVTNETGLGVVPMGELSRRFVDESGFLHQEIAAVADQVTLVVAGLPTELKSS